MAAMQLAHHPAGPLAAYVEKIWYCDGYQGVHRKSLVLPNGRFQLVISLAEGPLRAPGGPAGELGEIALSLILGIRSRFSCNRHGHTQISNGRALLAGWCARFL